MLPREGPPVPEGINPASDRNQPPAPAPTMVSPVERRDAVNEGYPDISPPPLTPEAVKGETGARSVLESWARAIELEEFDHAFALFGDSSREDWTSAEFASLFAGLDAIDVAVPDGVMEGAAGSLYYSGRTTITERADDGSPVRMEGSIVLRRANDVPGATVEQLRWRIHSLDLTRRLSESRNRAP